MIDGNVVNSANTNFSRCNLFSTEEDMADLPKALLIKVFKI